MRFRPKKYSEDYNKLKIKLETDIQVLEQQLEASLGLAAGSLKKKRLAATISKMVEREGADNLSAKSVRLRLEDVLGLIRDALKPQKSVLSQIIDEVLGAQP